MEKAIYSKDYRKLVDWLKSAREARGWSMRELGDLVEEPHSFIQKTESMERRLDLFEYVQYCSVLGVNPEEGISLIKRK